MKRFVYSRWDGTQAELRIDSERVLDSLSDLLLEGLRLESALEWLEREGFELAGSQFRVMGADELVREIEARIRSLEASVRLDRALCDLEARLDALLDWEAARLRSRHGLDSSRLGDFLRRRREGGDALSERIERFGDWEFDDEDAAEELRDLEAELDRLRELEEFLRRRGVRFRGPESADYEAAQRIRTEIESLEVMARAIAEGRFGAVSKQDAARQLSERGARSILLLRDLRASLERDGWLRSRQGAPELTPQAIRRLGASALANVYSSLRKGRPGRHETIERGVSLPRPDETRRFAFGDELRLDVPRTLQNAILRAACSSHVAKLPIPIPLDVADFEVAEADHSTETTTVLLLDMSWSMSWVGRFPAAKRVALALGHLIRSRFPRDHFSIVGFSTRARHLRARDLPDASWDMGDPFTNLQEALALARSLISKHRSPSPQILIITDGQPTAYLVDRELHVEWPLGSDGISPHAAEATLREVRRVTRDGITINTFMLDAAPDLVDFVDRMTRSSRGRAFFTSPRELGSFLLVDSLARRRKRARA